MNMMTSARKLFGYVLAAIMLGAFALPASATFVDEFRFVVAPTAISAGPGQTITAKITNRAPFDYLKSFTITLPAGVTIPVSPKPTSPTISASKISVNGAGNVITVSGVAIAYNASAVLTMSATYTPSDSCVPKPLTWVPTAKGGLFVDYEVFKLDAANSTVTQTLAAESCTMAFLTPPTPASVLSGGLVGGPVKVQVSPATAFVGKLATLTSSGGTFLAGTNVASIDAFGFATFPNLSISGTVGSYTLSASTNLSGGPTALPVPLSIAASDGVLDCVGTPNPGSDVINGTNGVTTVQGNRGLNKDNSPCKLVVYDLAIRDREVAFAWDTINQPNAAFSYEIVWKPEFVGSGGLPKRTQVAWTLTGPVPNYVDGRACLSPTLPAPYGTVTTDSGTTIVVSVTGTPPSGSFPIVIGTERLTVTGTAGSTWTVTRGVGGTTAVTHAANSPVMSTPFPLDGSAIQMPMCLKDETFVVLPSSSCSPENATTSCVGVTTTIFDAGDGYTSRN
jgi:hypothetical protein